MLLLRACTTAGGKVRSGGALLVMLDLRLLLSGGTLLVTGGVAVGVGGALLARVDRTTGAGAAGSGGACMSSSLAQTSLPVGSLTL